MKSIITIFAVMLYTTTLLTSCGDKKNNSEENKTSSIITDETKKIDSIKITEPSNSVPTLKIGDQEWMTEDIKTIIYNNGDTIYEAKTEKQWKNYKDKKEGCYRKLHNGTYLYNGYAINDKRGVLPADFIIPEYEHFNQLLQFLGGGNSQSGKATQSLAKYPIFIEDWVGDQETGGLEDVETKTNGTSGFKAVKGGFVYDHGVSSEGNCSYWWTSSTERAKNIVIDIGYCSNDLGGGQGIYPLSYGFALRAIKNKQIIK